MAGHERLERERREPRKEGRPPEHATNSLRERKSISPWAGGERRKAAAAITPRASLPLATRAGRRPFANFVLVRNPIRRAALEYVFAIK